MKIRLLLFVLLPVAAWSQVFEKIDKTTTGSNDMVYSCEEVLETQDGHIWFNSRAGNKYRLFEYDGTAYTYHKTFYDSLTGQTARDISASYFAQANDGTLFTNGGQNYSSGRWRRTLRDWPAIAVSHTGTVYFYTQDSIIAYSSGVYTKYPVALTQIPGLFHTPFGGLNVEGYAADKLNNLYVVNEDTGLVKINLTTQAVDYLPTNRVVSGFALDRMKSVYVSSGDEVYVGSWDGWFGYYDGNWHTYITNHDIADNFSRVNGFTEDDQQRIWLNAYASFKGIFARFDPAATAQFAEYITDTASPAVFDNYPRGIEIVGDTLFYAGVYQRDYLVKMNKGGGSMGMQLAPVKVYQHCTVYPNPALNSLTTVGILEGSYTLVSMTGQELEKGAFTNATVDITHLVPGVYSLYLNAVDGKLLKAVFIKQ
jgi:streptogramin lyase